MDATEALADAIGKVPLVGTIEDIARDVIVYLHVNGYDVTPYEGNVSSPT